MSKPWPKVNTANTNSDWMKLEDKIYAAASGAANTKAKKQSTTCGQASQQWPSAKVAKKKAVTAQWPSKATYKQVTAYEIDSDVSITSLVRTEPKKQELAVIDVQQAKAGANTPKNNLMPAWEKGKSGNPRGRPKGSGNIVSAAVREIVLADVNNHAAEVLARIR